MKNIGLLTKESLHQFKNKWMLFLFFLLFLIISIAVITGLIHFTYSFGHDAKHFSTLDRAWTLRFRAPKTDEEHVKKDGSYFKFLKYKSLSDEQIAYVLKNRGNVSQKKDDRGLFDATSGYMHNLFIEWLVNDSEIKSYFSPDNGIDLNVSPANLEKGILNNTKLNISAFDVRGPKVKSNSNDIYPWQIRSDKGEWAHRVIDSIDGFSMADFDPGKNENDVITTPAFLKFHHFKLGQTAKILYNGINYKIRFAATAIMPGQTVSDKSNYIDLNPVLYNKIYNANYEPISPIVQTINFDLPPRDKTKFDEACTNNYNEAARILSESFDSETVKTSLTRLNFDSSPIKSYQVQLMLYNILSWVVTVILIVLLITAYRFIQSLIINSDKPKLINLKSIGASSHEIGYYLGISFLPTLIIGCGVGLGLGEAIYYSMTTTLGRAVSFVLSWTPESMLGYYIFIAIFVGLILVGGFMAWLSTKGDRLSIHSKVKLSKTEMVLLSLKNWKVFKNNGFGNAIYSFQISNLLKAFSTFVVTILSLTVLGISLQFLTSVGAALNKKPFMYKDSGESLSYREYSENKPGGPQVVNTDKSLDQYIRIEDKRKLATTTANDNSQNPYAKLATWVANMKIDNSSISDKFNNHMNDLYFDDVDDLESFYVKNKEELANENNQKYIDDDFKNGDAAKIYNGFVSLDKLITTYRTEFGRKEHLPTVFFRDRPKTEDWLGYEEMHMATAAAFNYPVAVFNQNPEDSTKLKNDQIIVNQFLLRKFDKHIGEKIQIKFNGVSSWDMINNNTDSTTNSVSNDDLEFTIVGTNNRLYNNAEAIVNFDAIRASNSDHNTMSDYRNGVVSKSAIPYDIRNFVIPSAIGDGTSFDDYFPDAFNEKLITNLSFSSLPIIHDFYIKKTAEFRSFATILSILLVLVCLCIVLVISILISYENRQNILVLKTMGYGVGKTLSLFTIVYGAFISIGFIASVFIAGALIDMFTGTLVNRLGLALTHQYNVETIIIPLVIALVFFMAIAGIISYTYKLLKAQDITFAE